MEDIELSPILVTGAHRSGTTWIGKMLAADPSTAYVSEPLNVWHRPGVFRAPVKYWYQYICDENKSEFLSAFNELLEFEYHLWKEIRSIRSLKDFLRMGRDFRTFYYGLEEGRRAILKDPFAVFSAVWFAHRLNFKVLISVRHPLAFASSLKRLNWSFDFQDLLGQPLLMRDYLEPYRSQMGSVKSDDVIGKAALLWKMIYQTVYSMLSLNPDFILVRHEDLARDPANEFRKLFSSLGLDYSHHIEKIILETSSTENPMELSRRKVHDVKLDSRASMDNWKKRLTEDEIKRVREITEETSQLFYTSTEWA
ncbi:MAG TPA: sulfotransferase domain-containing protein [Anaerolineales bacterium]|nr:sulfotransferase domain-containing protein [Anaerolineales bacterium]